MKTDFLLIFPFILAVFPFRLEAAVNPSPGKGNAGVSAADPLISRTRYDDALRVLEECLEEDPDTFDQVVSRARRIFRARNEYADEADRLITLILEDPDNDREIYETILRLERFEQSRSDSRLWFISSLKKSAEFNYFRSVLDGILAESSRLAAESDFAAAARTAAGGMWLYRDAFFDGWKDSPEITAAVSSAVGRIESCAERFTSPEFLRSLDGFADGFVRAVESGAAGASAFLERNSALSGGCSAVIDGISDAAAELEAVLADIRLKSGDTSDASFIPFVLRLAGCGGESPSSGIIGAVAGLEASVFAEMENSVVSAMDKKCSAMLAELPAPGADSAAAAQTVRRYVPEIKGFSELLSGLYSMDGRHGAERLPCEYISSLSGALDLTVSAVADLEDVTARADSLSMSSAVDTGFTETASSLVRRTAEISAAAPDFDVAADSRAVYGALGEKYLLWRDYLRGGAESGVSVLLGKSAEIYAATMLSEAVRLEEMAESCSVYMTGLDAPLEDGNSSAVPEKRPGAGTGSGSGLLYFYPGIASSVLGSVIAGAEGRISEAGEFIGKMSAAAGEASPEFGAIVSLSERLGALRDSASDLKSAADGRMRLAALAENEAELRISESESALASGNFSLARRKLQEAMSKYAESLELCDDVKIRESCDRKMRVLDRRITDGENEVVVADVRRLKNLAMDSYFAGHFEEAERCLLQAAERWAVTNSGENGEISDMLVYVRTAVSMNTGRVLSPGSPLYPEMSQLLSIAGLCYESGCRKLDGGDLQGGYADLDRSLARIREVKLVYPLNRDASVLALRISRRRNPEKFLAEFGAKVSSAAEMCRNGDERIRREGYADLLDCHAVFPGYAGLEGLLYDTEVALGIRRGRTSAGDMRKSDGLVAEAARISGAPGAGGADFRNALEKLDAALSLNPDNNSAIILKDRISVRLGGTSGVVLSVSDERLYQQAVMRLQNNDIIGADAIALRLLSDPGNSGSGKLIELKKKIDARL